MIGAGEHKQAHAARVPSHADLRYAEDILQDRLGIDRIEAFAMIRAVAERDSRKILDVAEEVVRLRRLPA